MGNIKNMNKTSGLACFRLGLDGGGHLGPQVNQNAGGVVGGSCVSTDSSAAAFDTKTNKTLVCL